MKSYLNSLIAISASSLMLVACSNSVQDIPSDEGATFLVSQLSASSELVPHSTIPAIKEANFLHYKACIRDVAVQAAVVGEEFEVIAPDTRKKLRSDGDGCIAWSQAMVFPWLQKETWVQQEILVKATGHHLGAVRIPLYFNPWKEGANNLIDARYHQPAGPVTSREELQGTQAITKEDSSPLTLSGMNWRVLRRRTRGSETILEWQLEATPVLERSNLEGQIIRESLASGRATLKIQIHGRDISGFRNSIGNKIDKEVTWQGGSLKTQGELAVTTTELPRLGELASLNIEFALPGSLPDAVGTLPLNGIEQASTSELQPVVDEPITAQTVDHRDIEDKIGALDISNIKASIDTDDLEGYYLDQNLQLSITKAFRVEFHPTVILPGSSVMGMTPSPLTHGKLDVKVHLYAPNKAGLSFERPDLSQFTHLASDQATLEIRPDGLVSKIFKFPMAINRSPLLRLKTLMIIEATPIEEAAGVSAESFSAEIYPLANSNQVTAYAQTDNSDIFNHLPDPKFSDQRGLMPRIGDGVEALKTTLQHYSSLKGHEFVTKKLSEAARHSIDTKLARLTNSDVNGLNEADMRIMMSSRNLPKSVLRKLCREFFPTATVHREFNWGRLQDTLTGGDKWRACIENPQDFIKVSPSDHVESFLKTEKIGDITVTKPTFVSQARGDIFRGVGFFAAFGDRASVGEGDRDSATVETHVGFELSIPFIASVGIGGDRSHSVYQAREKAQMQSSFERQYTQQSDIELEYNRITLEFLAKMRRCLSASADAAKKTVLICDDNDRLSRVQENWYFIGDTRLNKIGVITNNTLPDSVEMAQVIRGEASFKKIWGEFRAEDRALVLEKLDEPSQGILQKPLSEQLITKDTLIGIGFPGVIVPY